MGWLIKGELPPEHKAQVHGQILVTGRKWADFLSYYPGCPPLLLRVYPDEFTEALGECLDKFWDQYQATLQKVRGMK